MCAGVWLNEHNRQRSRANRTSSRVDSGLQHGKCVTCTNSEFRFVSHLLFGLSLIYDSDLLDSWGESWLRHFFVASVHYFITGFIVWASYFKTFKSSWTSSILGVRQRIGRSLVQIVIGVATGYTYEQRCSILAFRKTKRACERVSSISLVYMCAGVWRNMSDREGSRWKDTSSRVYSGWEQGTCVTTIDGVFWLSPNCCPVYHWFMIQTNTRLLTEAFLRCLSLYVQHVVCKFIIYCILY